MQTEVESMCHMHSSWVELLGHAAGTSLGFMFRVRTGFMQQTLCNTQMLRHNSDTDEVCCQNNHSKPLALRAIFGDRYCISLGYFFIITISNYFFILKNTLFSSFPNYLFSFRSFDKPEPVISSMDKSAKTCCQPTFLYNFDQVPH